MRKSVLRCLWELEQTCLNEEWNVKEISDGAETATPETGTAHGCICGVKGQAPFQNAADDGALLQGVREVLDQRIEELSTTPARGAKRKVDFETATQSSSGSRKRVVIIGANFAGITYVAFPAAEPRLDWSGEPCPAGPLRTLFPAATGKSAACRLMEWSLLQESR